ncbi:hypothetical protein EP331_00150 [bacterium]|nr:MAG: hypothetical protein EP331_00150 [bacterium]
MKKTNLELLQKVANGELTPEQADAELLVLSNVSARNWAKMREDACRVREQVAINFMLDVYCDVEVTEELQNEAYEDFKKRYVR